MCFINIKVLLAKTIATNLKLEMDDSSFEKDEAVSEAWLKGLWSVSDPVNERSFYEETSSFYEDAMIELEWKAPELSMVTLENYEKESGMLSRPVVKVENNSKVN